jgi:nitrile hydratase alpha subunit
MSAHDHGHDHGHAHPRRPDAEDAPLTRYMAMTEAVAALLLEKGIFSADELRRTLETIDSRSPADGARVVARAWVDPGYAARLLSDVNAAAAELGIDAGGIPIRAVANRPGLHNVIVCTLCSCYPKMLLGVPPAWYKSVAYRSRTVADPRGVLAEFGVELPEGVEVRVHDSTADLRYIVLPMRPKGTQGWSETQLAEIVTRDSMIGTATPAVPTKPTARKRKKAA